jgi:hypothetical protein
MTIRITDDVMTLSRTLVALVGIAQPGWSGRCAAMRAIAERGSAGWVCIVLLT